MREQKKDTNRIAKVNSLIRRELGPILLVFLQGHEGLITITKADTSKDMKWCKVWISILPIGNPHPSRQVGTPSPKGRGEISLSQADKKPQATPSLDNKILDYLAKNIYDIQGELNKHFFTKIIPRISFHLDTSPRYAQHIDEVIRKIHDEEETI